MKKIKKGFTLVELLVVIAILAILASVSVIGYLSFTEKAKLSNIETEMAQIREVVRDSLLDGSKKTINDVSADGKVYTLSFSNKKVNAIEATEDEKLSAEVWNIAFPDLASFDDSENGRTIEITSTSLTYTNTNVDAYAVWTFEGDTITSSTLKN